jgi:NAD(P)-dependent dehydrogenase (short-subunit alcohol dehydrogenase family)
VNIVATMRLIDAVRPRMAEGGCAVLISSMSAHMIGSPDLDALLDATPAQGAAAWREACPTPSAAYPYSKRAVMRLVQREAAAFGERKARIVSISPGLIDTGMGRTEMASHPQMKDVLAITPLGRLGLGDEIASVAVLLCSSDASYITGCDIRVDGGSTAALGL